jgi:hypothetical protein
MFYAVLAGHYSNYSRQINVITVSITIKGTIGGH